MHHERYLRAALLYQQHRYADTERELLELLAGEASNTDALHLLAATYLAQQRIAEARTAAGQVLAIAPGNSDAHSLLARIELVDDSPSKAETHARQAITMEPGESAHYGILALVMLRLREPEAALAAADQGLALDPEDLQCLNMRTEALARLGRKEEADHTIQETLRLDPENPYTHSNTGWAMLRQGEHHKALEHFRESLRRDPTNDHAKAGMVEALKARYTIYRLFLRYMFWVGSMKQGAQWALIIGIYFGQRMLGSLTGIPWLAPFIWPVLILMVLFVLSTWVMVPLSNLLLRLNKYGRYALDREETISSYFTAAALSIAVVGGIAFLAGGPMGFLAMCLFGLVMMIPLASMLGGRKRSKTLLIAAAGFVALLGIVGVWSVFRTGDVMDPIMRTFFYANLGYQILANVVRG